MNFDALVVGAGPAGCAAARTMAEEAGARVLVLEKRPYAGGNTYDETDASGVLIHQYGPHIFHTGDEKAFAFLSRFTDWRFFRHTVLADVRGTYLPVPFNLKSLALSFPGERGERLRARLIAAFGLGARVPIQKLMETQDAELRELAQYVYNNIFLFYTKKQWGTAPDALDPAAMARVPVRVSDEDGYFADKYQGVPKEGFTRLFSRMLDHPGIRAEYGADAAKRLKLSGGALYLDGEECKIPVIYTGPLDELMEYSLGRLPYRTLDFAFETHQTDSYQPSSVVNYTVSERYTRITEFKKLTGQVLPGVTTIAKEYPRACDPGDIPYYPIPSESGRARYYGYRKLADACPNLHPLGRLAEYEYMNIDVAVARALALCVTLKSGRGIA